MILSIFIQQEFSIDFADGIILLYLLFSVCVYRLCFKEGKQGETRGKLANTEKGSESTQTVSKPDIR